MGSLLNKILLIVFVLMIDFSIISFAKTKNNREYSDFTNSERYAGLVINSRTGEVLYQKNADRVLYPASLTKMMTMYVTFKKLKEGKINLADKIPVSHKAASMERTNLSLKPGQKILVRDAIYGVIIHSANDAAVALAESISGSEEAFAFEMNRYAKALGMNNTNFKNANGLPNAEQVTTAYDMARLGIALKRDFPDYYPMFSRKSFSFNGRIYNTHNRVLSRYKYAEGIKTGFIRSSGFNLVSSTHSPMGDLVGVVFGGPTSSARDNHMIKILDYGYKTLAQKKGYTVAQMESLENQESTADYVDSNLTTEEDVFDKHLVQASIENVDLKETKRVNKSVKKQSTKAIKKSSSKKVKKVG